MADDPKPEPEDKPDDAPKPDDKPDDDVRAMRAALKKANKEAADLRTRFKELEDKDKSESQLAVDRAAAAEKRAEQAESKALRLEVATKKGLTASQAKRLVGTTEEELEADADEILEAFKPADGGKPAPVPSKPSPDLRSGGDPETEPDETDPRKLAAQHPRPGF